MNRTWIGRKRRFYVLVSLKHRKGIEDGRWILNLEREKKKRVWENSFLQLNRTYKEETCVGLWRWI
jgi:hypothetical protein